YHGKAKPFGIESALFKTTGSARTAASVSRRVWVGKCAAAFWPSPAFSADQGMPPVIERPRPRRVLMVNTHATQGGAARMASTLAKVLHASGKADVRLVHCGDKRTTPPLYGVRRSGSRQINAIIARIGGSMAVHDMGVSEIIIREARNADVIHLHNLHG